MTPKLLNWSCSLEGELYEENLGQLIEEAIEAVSMTAPGFYVNLVTPGKHGEPETYLLPELERHFGDQIEARYIDQCGCGGYVLRVWKKEERQ